MYQQSKNPKIINKQITVIGNWLKHQIYTFRSWNQQMLINNWFMAWKVDDQLTNLYYKKFSKHDIWTTCLPTHNVPIYFGQVSLENGWQRGLWIIYTYGDTGVFTGCLATLFEEKRLQDVTVTERWSARNSYNMELPNLSFLHSGFSADWTKEIQCGN